MVDPTLLRPASPFEKVAAPLRAMVFRRQREPGKSIDELAFASDRRIGRTSPREALKGQGHATRAERFMHGHPTARRAALKGLARAREAAHRGAACSRA